MRRENGWFHRLDPRAKIVGVVAFVVATALMTDLRLVILSLLCAMIIAIVAQTDPRKLGRPLAAVLPIIAVVSASSYFYGGAEMALAILGRSLASVLVLLVLVTATESFELWSAFRRLGCPPILTSLLMLVNRYVLILMEQLERMSLARRARGFRTGQSLLNRSAMRVMAYSAGGLLVRSVERADRVYDGLRSRAFTKEFTYWVESRLTTADGVFVCVLGGVAALMVVLQAGVLS